MKKQIILKKQTGTEQGTVWRWQIKAGREVLAGGYCRTKKDALNDATLSLGGGGGSETSPRHFESGNA